MALSDQIKTAVAKYIWGRKGSASALSSATSAIDYIDGGVDELIISKTPIVSITSLYDVSASANVTATEYDFDPDVGFIYRHDGNDFGVSYNKRRYKVTYTYGYSAIPDDIQLAIDTWTNYLTADSTGALSGYKTGDDSETYSGDVSVEGMPSTVRKLLDKYKRRLF